MNIRLNMMIILITFIRLFINGFFYTLSLLWSKSEAFRFKSLIDIFRIV